MEASSESRRLLRRRERANRGRRFPRVIAPSTPYKPGQFAFVYDPDLELKIKAAYDKDLTASGDSRYHIKPFSHSLAKMQLELKSLGASSKLRITPSLQKLVDEAREAMLANNPNHPAAAATGEHTDLGKPIETLVENLNLEASSPTGTRAEAKAGSGVSRETMDENLNPAATGTKAQVKAASILNCPREVPCKVTMVENLNHPAPGSSTAIGGY